MGNKITEKLRQGGFTLMEMIAAMVVMGSVMVGVYSLSEQSLKNTKSSVLALHLRTVGDAANQYIRANTGLISGYLNSNPSKVYMIPIGDLAGSYLPAGYSVTNSEGQAACVLVVKKGNNLNALVLTEGGNAIDDLTLGQIAATIGGSGGGVYSTATSTVKGAMGGWSFPTSDFTKGNNKGKKCDGTAGTVSVGVGHPMMALWLAETDTATLYRDAVTGNEALNTMNTPIIMGDPVIKTEGSACGGASDPAGAIARAPDGSVLSCVKPGNTWQKPGGTYWRDPVATFADLPTTDLGGTVRVTRDTGRAFMWKAAVSAWWPLAVDQNGDLKVSRDLNVSRHLTVDGNTYLNQDVGIAGNAWVAKDVGVSGNIGVGGNAWVTKDVGVSGNIGVGGNAWVAKDVGVSGNSWVGGTSHTEGTSSTSGDSWVGGDSWTMGTATSKNSWTSGNSTVSGDSWVSKNSTVAGRFTANEYIQINGTVNPGDPCSPNGLVARNGSGELLSCVSGRFKYVAGSRGIIGGMEGFASEGTGGFVGCRYNWGVGVCTPTGFYCSDGILTAAMTAHDEVGTGGGEPPCAWGSCHVAHFFCIK